MTVAPRWDNDKYRVPGGGSAVEGLWVRVHPETRYAHIGSNDFGFWKIGPPDEPVATKGSKNTLPVSKLNHMARSSNYQKNVMYLPNGRIIAIDSKDVHAAGQMIPRGIVIVSSKGKTYRSLTGIQ